MNPPRYPDDSPLYLAMAAHPPSGSGDPVEAACDRWLETLYGLQPASRQTTDGRRFYRSRAGDHNASHLRLAPLLDARGDSPFVYRGIAWTTRPDLLFRRVVATALEPSEVSA